MGRLVILIVFSLSAYSSYAYTTDSLNQYYSDTSYTYKVLKKILKNYDRVEGTLSYRMSMKQYDSSHSRVLDSSVSRVKYSGVETSMIQKDDEIVFHDSVMVYVYHPKKQIYIRVRNKGNADMKYLSNPMSFLLKQYKDRKIKIRKHSETKKTYTYSVDFDFQKDMYLVTADKKTDYIKHVYINYLVPDNANQVSSRILEVDYSDYRYSKKLNDKEINKYITNSNDEYVVTEKYKDYKINVYGN